LEYFSSKLGYQAKRGSNLWNQVTMGWKTLLSEIEFVRPMNREELVYCSFWMCPIAPTVESGFLKARAARLHKNDLWCYKDI
jgi:hypothetical protein